MPRRRREIPWKPALHQSELLPELRRLYRILADRGDAVAPWYEIARVAQLNPTTVQRLLASTKIARTTTGRQLAALEAVALAMGYRVSLIPTLKGLMTRAKT